MIESQFLSTKSAMINAIDHALSDRTGLAIGKLGYSEQLLLLFNLQRQNKPSFLSASPILPTYIALKYHCEHQTGIFPTDLDFLTTFAADYASEVCKADFLGLFGSPNEAKLIQALPFRGKFLKFTDTEPDRSIPYDPAYCYLGLLRGKRVLVISPFASFAKERATKAIFESVWQKISIPWFDPESFEAIDIPYSYTGQTETHQKFLNSTNLLKHIKEQITEFDFDVALIAAGALAIPLATHIKELGKVGISLGGHLQTVFGILGDRWMRDPEWRDNYITESWTRLPQILIPENAHQLTDNKSYW